MHVTFNKKIKTVTLKQLVGFQCFILSKDYKSKCPNIYLYLPGSHHSYTNSKKDILNLRTMQTERISISAEVIQVRIESMQVGER